MADVPVEVKKAPQAETAAPEIWGSFRNEMDRLFDRFGGSFGFPSIRHMADIEPAWRSFGVSAPAIDMSEDDKALRFQPSFRGWMPRMRSVSVRRQVGPQRREVSRTEEKNKNYYHSERSYGSFQRSFELPASVDHDKIAAYCSKGMLTITLPKTVAVQKQQKKIEIKSG